jgi:predicted RecB family nuclease
MDITEDIFESYLYCKLKAFLKLANQSGTVSEFEKSQSEFRENYLNQSVREMQERDRIGEAGQSQNSDIAKGEDVLFKTVIASQGLVAHCDILKKVSGESALGYFHYVPVRFTRSEKISKIDELLVGFTGLILGQLQERLPDYGNIVHSKMRRVHHIKLEHQIAQVSRIVREIREEAAKGQLPKLHLNDHCKVCEFQESCKAKAKEKDDLSLIRGIPERTIGRLNKRGIFTVTQYSFTFRPRRKRNKSRRLFELQALAIRDNKTYILEKPKLPSTTTKIFLDVEGDPDRDFYYLIGVVVDNNGVINYYSYWADDMEEKPIDLFF